MMLCILARRETALRNAIIASDRQVKLHSAAESVRIAQLNVTKAKLAAFRDRGGLHTKIEPGATIDRELKWWSEVSPAEIVSIYQEVKSLVADDAPQYDNRSDWPRCGCVLY